jgi:hypothetical protein
MKGDGRRRRSCRDFSIGERPEYRVGNSYYLQGYIIPMVPKT